VTAGIFSCGIMCRFDGNTLARGQWAADGMKVRHVCGRPCRRPCSPYLCIDLKARHSFHFTAELQSHVRTNAADVLNGVNRRCLVPSGMEPGFHRRIGQFFLRLIPEISTMYRRSVTKRCFVNSSPLFLPVDFRTISSTDAARNNGNPASFPL